jgi:hypothetical protein
MPYTFAPPAVMNRVRNPADELVDLVQANGQPAPLGATTASCNGTLLSLFNTDLPGNNIGGSGTDWRFTRVDAITFAFTSNVTLPPAPTPTGIPRYPTGWVSRFASLRDLQLIAARFNGGAAPVPPAGITKATGRVLLLPRPSAQAFCDHVRHHEMQHVADIRWVIEQTIAPWVAWLDQLHANSPRPYTARQRSSLEWFLGGGVQPVYQGRYMFELMNEVAEKYHRSALGSAPHYQATQFLRTGSLELPDVHLVVEISAQTPILAPILYTSPPHRVYSLASKRDHAAGVSPDIITNGGIAAIPTPAPAIVLTQADINNYEKAQAVGTDEGEDSALATFFS